MQREGIIAGSAEMNREESSYWLFSWLNEHGITNVGQAGRLLAESREVERLREIAAGATYPAAQAGAFSILAGKGVDLSGVLDCHSARCRRRQVDELFEKAWFYFDRIVVADAVGHS